MNIVVVGQGAIGSLWSAKLAALPSCDVSIFSTSQATQPSKFKFSNKSPNINMTINFTHHLGLSEQLTIKQATKSELKAANIVLICLKAFHVTQTLIKLMPMLNDKAIIILCHNGMGTIDEVTPLLPQNMALMAMLTTHGAYRPQKSHVIHTGIGYTDIGLVKGQVEDEKITALTLGLNTALKQVCWQNNIQEKQWYKLAINCIINPITAINQVKNGHVLHARFKPLIEQLCAEISSVALLEGVQISTDNLLNIVKDVASATAKNSSSMLCDINNKQQTEIDYITGFLLKKSAQYNVSLPANNQLYLDVKSIEQGYLASGLTI